MIRATTGGVMRSYRSNLMNSFINMNNGRNTVLTQRTFNSFAEDPAAAAKAFRLRKSRMTVESQHNICSDVYRKYQTGIACLQSIDEVLCTKEGEYGYYMKTLTGTTLSMLNDPEGDARVQLSKVLDQMSQQIIQTMNQKYGDNFIFAGADGHNVPFEIREVNGQNRLYYRGVWVDASIPDVLTGNDSNSPLAVSEDGTIIDDPTKVDQVYYLDMSRVKTISASEYNKKYVLPDVDGGPDSPKAYSKDDVNPTDPAYDSLEDDVIYYKYEDADGNDQYISQEEYEAIKERVDSTQFLSKADGSGGTVPVTVDENGNVVEDGGYYVIFDESQLMDKYDYDAQMLEYEKLQYLAQETLFVDIGYGFQEDPVTGKLIESSAFNSALNGINFIGWGLDDDGDPKNLYSLVQKMREVADSVPEAGKWDDATWTKFDQLVSKFEKAVSNYQTEFVDLDASTGKLSAQQELLEDNFYNLQEQYSELEDVDMVEAITSFLWAEYCYNAALKVGNSILGQSLMDYLS